MKKSKLLALAALASLGVNANAANEITSGEKYYIQNVESGKYISAGAYWGTRSVLADQGVDFTVNIADGKYTLVSGVKGQNTALRPSDGFMDQSGTWEVIPNGDGTFKIKGSEGYLKYDGTDFPNVKGADADSGTDWKFLTNADREALLTGASASNPKDATFYIQAPDFVDGDYRITGTKVWGTVVTGTGGNYGSGCTLVNSSNGEMYNKAKGSKLIQKLTGIKNGKYKVSCLAFYRAGNSATAAAGYDKENDKDGNQFAWFFANDEKVAVKSVFHGAPNAKKGGYTTAGGDFYIPKNQGEAAACFSADNNYLNEIEVVVTDGTLSIGIEKTGNVDEDWVLFDSFRLTYYGEVTDLSAYKSGFDTALAAATNVDQNKAMNSIVLKTLTDALKNYSSDFSTYTTADAINEAKNAWNDAANAAANSIAAYAAIDAKLTTLDAAGQANFKASEVGQKYVAKTYTDEDYSDAYITAVKSQAPGADMTPLIKNAQVASADGWTGARTNTGQQYTDAPDNTYFDFWNNSGSMDDACQKITLPEGVFTLKAATRADANVTANKNQGHIYAKVGEQRFTTPIHTDGNSGGDLGNGWSWTTVDDIVVPKEMEITIGFYCPTPNGVWAGADDFHLIYKGAIDKAALVDNFNALKQTVPSGKMNSVVATKLSTAKDVVMTVDNTKTEIDTAIKNLNTAISNANTSITYYQEAAAYLSKASALDAAGQASYANAVASYQTAYTNGTLVSLSADDKATMDAALLTAVKAQTSDNADYTAFIVNPDFEVNGLSGWTNQGNFAGAQGNHRLDSDGIYVEHWHGTGTFNVYQELKDLPAGTYTLKARAFIIDDSQSTTAGLELASLYAGDKSTVIKTGDFDSPENAGDYEVEFSLAATGDITIGAKSEFTTNALWFAVDDFRLIRNGDCVQVVYATTEDYAALNAAISAKTIGFAKGEYAPYNNVAAMKALKDAKGINQAANNEQKTVQDATSALTNATWTANTEEVNAVYDGHFDLTTIVRDATSFLPTGWSNTGYNTRVYKDASANAGINATSNGACLFAKFSTAYGKEDGYTMPLKAGTYSLSFIYGGWNEQGARDIKVYKADGSENANVSTVRITAPDNKAHTTASSWANYSGYVVIPSDGDYVLEFGQTTSNQNQICISDIEFKTTKDIELTHGTALDANATPQNITYKRNGTSGKWQSLYVPFSIDMTKVNEAKVAIAKFDDVVKNGDDVTISISKVHEGTIAAKTPLFIATVDADIQSINTGVSAIAAKENGTSTVGVAEITGILEEAKAGIQGSYIMSGGSLRMVPASMSTVKLGVNHWYMSLPANARIRLVVDGFEDEDATAIAEAIAEQLNTKVYSINGVEVNPAKAKGLVIKNGKKILVK